MKRIIPALALGFLLAGCTDARSDVYVQGRIPVTPCTDPSGICPCTYPQSATEFGSNANVEARGQQVADGKVQMTLAFELENTTRTPSVTDSSGTNTSDPSRDDAVVTGADVNVTDLGGNSLVSETVVASGYVKGQGQTGVVSFDVMAEPLADLIRANMAFPKSNPANAQLLLQIVFKGHLISGTDFQTAPFQNELDVSYKDFFAAPADSTGSYETIAILSDAGLSDEQVAGDGSQTLLNDENAYVHQTLTPQALPDGGSTAFTFGTCE